jgi:hypothetical protein
VPMSVEQNVLLFLWFAGTAVIAFAIPRNQWHALVLCFLAGQAIGWMMETMLLELRVVTFPIREFPRATLLAVTNKIMFIPVMSGLYVTYEPRKSWRMRLIYLLVWACLLASIENLIATFTKLLDYTGFNWWWAVLLYASVLAAINGIVRWFFRDRSVFRHEKIQERTL